MFNAFYSTFSGKRTVRLFTCGWMLFLAGLSKAQVLPADTLGPTLEVSYGAGPLQLTGGATDGKVRWTAPAGWGKGKDSLLVYLSHAKRSQLFLRPGSSDQVKDTKEPLLVTLPAKGQVDVRSGKGAIRVSKLQGHFRAEAESGPITMEEMQGSFLAYTKEGAITVRSSRASGSVGTGKGDVLIENTEGDVAGFSREGKVVTRFTKAYLQQKTTPFGVNLDMAFLEIEALPAGGSIRLRKGTVLVKEAPKGVSAWIEEGDITLEKAAGNASASSRNGNISCAFQGQPGQVELLTAGGNVTLTLPANFAGTIYLEQEQNDARKGTYQVKSDFDLGTVKAEPLKGPQGQTFALLTKLETTIGTGPAVIRIWAVNGNVTILKK